MCPRVFTIIVLVSFVAYVIDVQGANSPKDDVVLIATTSATLSQETTTPCEHKHTYHPGMNCTEYLMKSMNGTPTAAKLIELASFMKSVKIPETSNTTPRPIEKQKKAVIKRDVTGMEDPKKKSQPQHSTTPKPDEKMPKASIMKRDVTGMEDPKKQSQPQPSTTPQPDEKMPKASIMKRDVTGMEEPKKNDQNQQPNSTPQPDEKNTKASIVKRDMTGIVEPKKQAQHDHHQQSSTTARPLKNAKKESVIGKIEPKKHSHHTHKRQSKTTQKPNQKPKKAAVVKRHVMNDTIEAIQPTPQPTTATEQQQQEQKHDTKETASIGHVLRATISINGTNNEPIDLNITTVPTTTTEQPLIMPTYNLSKIV